MRKWATLFGVFLLGTFFIRSNETCAQNIVTDTSAASSIRDAINLYHSSLSPETGLYDGRQYPYDAYYPSIINEGHPFFLSQRFSSGSVFYNNILYENVPLLYDIIKGELLINDPTKRYMVQLNNERIQWFVIAGHTFIRIQRDSTKSYLLSPGFYDLLYNGNTALIKKISKTLKENTASVSGMNEYVVETNEYFIRKNSQYYKVNNKKSLMLVVNNNRKEVGQFMKKNRLNLKKNKDYALAKIAAYYDSIDNQNTKADN